MCGIIAIAGNSSKHIQNKSIEMMLKSLSRRGPDDHDFVRLDSTILGQTRLAIVDISGGHQPMKDNKRNFTLVFNGEIYGYKDIRTNLESLGHTFSTNSDTEVILKSYTQFGKDCVLHLDGMFSIALWDGEKNELFIARDRFGKKPLYYAWKNNTIFIASEIKALFESGEFKGKISPEAIDNYLQLSYIPPWKTVYSNISMLPPAHASIIKNGKMETWQYWNLPENPLTISYEEAKEKLHKLFDDAVKKRMIADVEIGSLLSGGVDSTLVTAYAQKHSSHPIKTFSVNYGNHINELPFAKEASAKIGTDHFTLNTEDNLMEELEKVARYMDEPHGDSSDISQHLVSHLASSKVKVAMTGDGADELFMGYGWYWKYWNTRKIIRLKNVIFSNQFKEHIKNVSIFSINERKKLWKDRASVSKEMELLNIRDKMVNGTKKINMFDLTVYLPGQLLSKIDRLSMMHSLEIRSPFLDYKLAEFVYNLPEKYKVNKKSGKIILKDLLRPIMPDTFVDRRKQGFGAPVRIWLQTEKIKKYVIKELGINSPLLKFFKEEKMTEILNRFYKKNDTSVEYQIWSLLCLSIWLRFHNKYHE